MLVVGGMIGAGKTTVSTLLGKELGYDVIREKVDESLVLPLFYTSTEEERIRHRYPFLLQLEFLNARFASIKEGLRNHGRKVVMDRSIYEDWYFAHVNHQLGGISDLEMKIYSDLLNNMMQEIAEIPSKAPDLFIYLHGDFETILERIALRGREFEQGEELVAYYRRLWEGYDDWVVNCYDVSDVLEFNIADYDLLEDEKSREAFVNTIRTKLGDKLY
ncbi:MAG: deoxynucleoside kinase [Actinomycetaceae bacterium]|nr:deoxynucleoside kinase [Actinomycetaceae bacterium]